jgi:hypothetical protein
MHMEGNMEDREDSDSEIETIDEEQKGAGKKENLRRVRRDESCLVLRNV